MTGLGGEVCGGRGGNNGAVRKLDVIKEDTAGCVCRVAVPQGVFGVEIACRYLPFRALGK